MMFKSREIRWFQIKSSSQLADWFASFDMSFDNSKERTDYYLPLPDNDNIGVKIREGKIEVKNRLGQPEVVQLAPSVNGNAEYWVKWSFMSPEDDPLVKEILEKKQDWIPVRKSRMGVKLIPDLQGKIAVLPLTTMGDNGCQIEYTQIFVGSAQERWFTFGFEWFGDMKLSVPDDFMKKLLSGIELNKDHSMGYAQFLRDVN